MIRPSWDTYFMNLAVSTSQRGTCPRRKVGCVLVSKSHRILSTGYNGNAPDEPHCIEHPCDFALAPKGSGLNKCPAIHSEVNAIAFCPDIEKIHTAYITHSPCVDCIKLLLISSCERIVFAHQYPHPEAEERWKRAGREWVHLTTQEWQ
jgi:dCMP deaminase